MNILCCDSLNDRVCAVEFYYFFDCGILCENLLASIVGYFAKDQYVCHDHLLYEVLLLMEEGPDPKRVKLEDTLKGIRVVRVSKVGAGVSGQT